MRGDRRFLDAYEAQGFHFWGLTTGNEPMNGVVGPLIRFNSMGWTPFQVRTWIGDNLGPTLRAERGNESSKHADVRILTLDDQRINLPWWLDVVSHGTARRGVAWRGEAWRG